MYTHINLIFRGELMIKRLRYFVLPVILLTLCILFVASSLVFIREGWRRDSEEAAVPEMVELDFFQMREEALAGFDSVISAFHEAYPHIRVSQQNVAGAQELLLARMQRDDLPSIFTYWPTQLSYLKAVERGSLLPLTDQPFLSRINRAPLEMARSADGEIYALPINCNCVEVFYNKDLFATLHLSVPETVEELFDICEILEEKGITPCVFTRRDGKIAHAAQGVLAALCPDYLDLLEHAGRGTLNEAEEKELTDAFRVLHRFTSFDQPLALYPAQANRYFLGGKAAMYYAGSYVLGDLVRGDADFEIGVFPFPGYTREDRVLLWSVDTAICISAACQHTEEALLFIDFLTGQEAASVYTDLDMEPSCITDARQENPVSRAMEQHMSEYRQAEWIKSRFSYETALAFELAVRSYVLDGDMDALMDELRHIF